LIMLVTTTDASIEQAERDVGIRSTVSKMAMQDIVPCIRAMLRCDEFHRLGDNPGRPD